MEVKIVFVGIHFKDKMKALDSRTKTGYIVDEIIAELPGNVGCVKRNLFPTNYLPKGEEKREYLQWFLNQLDRDEEKFLPVYVLLGGVVQRELEGRIAHRVKLMHPGALRFGHDPDKYIGDALYKISEEIESVLRYHEMNS